MMILGQFIGGTIIVFLIAWVIDRGLASQLTSSLLARSALSAGCAVVIAVAISGFGNADGGPWNPGTGLLVYPIAGLIAGALRFFQLHGRAESPETDQ